MSQASISVVVPQPVPLPKNFKLHSNWFRTYGPKVKRLVDSYSELEWRFLLTLEADPNVRVYCEQFPRVDEPVNGKKLNCVFDFWIRYQDGSEELIEIKPVSKLTRNALGELAPPRWDDINEWCRLHQCKCRFVTDENLKQHEKLTDNWAQLLPHIQRAVTRNNDGLLARIVGAVVSSEVAVINDLGKMFPAEDTEELQDLLLLALHQRRVAMDLQSAEAAAVNFCTKVIRGLSRNTPLGASRRRGHSVQ